MLRGTNGPTPMTSLKSWSSLALRHPYSLFKQGCCQTLLSHSHKHRAPSLHKTKPPLALSQHVSLSSSSQLPSPSYHHPRYQRVWSQPMPTRSERCPAPPQSQLPFRQLISFILWMVPEYESSSVMEGRHQLLHLGRRNM